MTLQLPDFFDPTLWIMPSFCKKEIALSIVFWESVIFKPTFKPTSISKYEKKDVCYNWLLNYYEAIILILFEYALGKYINFRNK